MNRSMSEDSAQTELQDEEEEEKIIHSQELTVHFPSLPPQTCRVSLTRSSVFIEEAKKDSEEEEDKVSLFECIDEQFPIEDLYGFHIVQKENQEPSVPNVYVCLVLYSCHGTEAQGQSPHVRKRILRLLEINRKGYSYEGNLKVAEDWAKHVAKLLEDRCPKLYYLQKQKHRENKSIDNLIQEEFKRLSSSKSSKELELEPMIQFEFHEEDTFTLQRSILFRRKFLAVVNPVSGQGKSATLFQDQISPILQDCGVSTDLRITEHPHHALSLMAEIDLGVYDGIISIGGDGLLNEIVNGLRTRKDADKCADIPIGIIATGSGNGLARSIAAYCGVTEEEYKGEPVLHTTLSVARGCIVPVNLTEVKLDQRVFYSFLSCGWGLLSDIDIESEVLRSIGEIRFFIWSFIRLAKLRRYKASLSYIPFDLSGGTIKKGRVIVDDEFVSVYSACQAYIGSDMYFAPEAKPNDNVIHLTYLPSDTGRLAAAKFLAALDQGQGNQLQVVPCNYVKVKEFTIKSEGGIEGCLTVDGEQVKGEEITVKMCDSPLLMLGMG